MGQGNKKRKPGRYANGALISSAKADMQTEQQKRIRRNADNLRNGLKKAGIKKPGPDYEAGHNPKGKSVNKQKGGWEKVSKNRAVEEKNRSRLKVRRKK